MYRVYQIHIKTKKTQCVNRDFENYEDAIKHVAKCYEIDKELGQLGEYVYDIK